MLVILRLNCTSICATLPVHYGIQRVELQEYEYKGRIAVPQDIAVFDQYC